MRRPARTREATPGPTAAEVKSGDNDLTTLRGPRRVTEASPGVLSVYSSECTTEYEVVCTAAQATSVSLSMAAGATFAHPGLLRTGTDLAAWSPR